jgi:hypothetical protein
MRPSTLRAGESSPPPASTSTSGGDLSRAESRRRRAARSRSLYGTLDVLRDREQTIADQRTQIVEHRRTVSSYLGRGKDSR